MRENPSLKEAREISKKFCSDFKLPYCEIYFVDDIDGCFGIYIWVDPIHILLIESFKGLIGILIHELTHHLEHYGYNKCPHPSHGYDFNLARSRVITWCRKNISDKANWTLPLKAYVDEKEMRAFKL